MKAIQPTFLLLISLSVCVFSSDANVNSSYAPVNSGLRHLIIPNGSIYGKRSDSILTVDGKEEDIDGRKVFVRTEEFFELPDSNTELVESFVNSQRYDNPVGGSMLRKQNEREDNPIHFIPSQKLNIYDKKTEYDLYPNTIVYPGTGVIIGKRSYPISGSIFGKRNAYPISGSIFGKRNNGYSSTPKRVYYYPVSGSPYGKRVSYPVSGSIFGKRTDSSNTRKTIYYPINGSPYGKRAKQPVNVYSKIIETSDGTFYQDDDAHLVLDPEPPSDVVKTADVFIKR